MRLSRLGVFAFAAFTAVSVAPLSSAQATFKASDPAFSQISRGVQAATDRSSAAALVERVVRGGLDTRGTRVQVQNSRFEQGSTGSRPVLPDSELQWHNPFGSNFTTPSSSRWYQKDGFTQVFRVFPGDTNLSSVRVGAARSEAYVRNLTTLASDGRTMTFSARFHVAEHNGSRDVMLFQSKGRWRNSQFRSTNSHEYPAWSVALFAQADGSIVLRDRAPAGGKGRIIQTGFRVGQSFNLRVVDDGYNFSAFINGRRLISGVWERGDTPTVARWGAYVQGNGAGVLEGPLSNPQVVYVSGAQVTVR